MGKLRVGGSAVLVLLSGCYGFYPHELKRQVPPRVEGRAELRLEEKNFTSWSDCGASDKNCEWHDGELQSPYHYKRYYPYYGDEAINLGQLSALLNGDKYTAAWDRIEGKKGTCKISIAPTVVYFAAAIGSVVAFTLSKDEPDSDMRTYAYIGAGVSGGAALLSYPLGGYACMQAKGIADKIEARYGESPYEVLNPGNSQEERKIADLQRRIAAFNRGERPGAPREDVRETPTPTGDPPSEAPGATEGFTPGAASIMETLTDAGELTMFTALLVETGLDRQLASGGPYTVAALDDAALTKAKQKLDRLDKNERVQTLRDLIFVGVVTSGERTLETLGGKKMTLELRKDGNLKVRGRSGSMRFLGNAINGAIYVID
ncbi:MAG: fasciclin domain-containing protein [Kofleriaceae bacterium]|nr:fasciclin domain-containing protein [Kofleriaceae bacterium]